MTRVLKKSTKAKRARSRKVNKPDLPVSKSESILMLLHQGLEMGVLTLQALPRRRVEAAHRALPGDRLTLPAEVIFHDEAGASYPGPRRAGKARQSPGLAQLGA